MQDNYNYPLDIEWTQPEMLVVMAMWQALEDTYEKGLPAAHFLTVYQEFKTVIKSIGEERKLGRDFEEVSGYSLYRAVQAAKAAPDKMLKMKGA